MKRFGFLLACLCFVVPLSARADETIQTARERMTCDAWMQIHHDGGAQAKAIEEWSVLYLKRVAHDFAVDMAHKTGARAENDDGGEFDDTRVITWIFLHCREHPDDTMTVTAMSWSMALSLVAGPRPLPGY